MRNNPLFASFITLSIALALGVGGGFALPLDARVPVSESCEASGSVLISNDGTEDDGFWFVFPGPGVTVAQDGGDVENCPDPDTCDFEVQVGAGWDVGLVATSQRTLNGLLYGSPHSYSGSSGVGANLKWSTFRDCNDGDDIGWVFKDINGNVVGEVRFSISCGSCDGT